MALLPSAVPDDSLSKVSKVHLIKSFAGVMEGIYGLNCFSYRVISNLSIFSPTSTLQGYLVDPTLEPFYGS